MKNIFLSLSVIASIAMASCKKDRVCTCTSSSTAPGSTPMTMEVTIFDVKKSDAKKACVKTTNDYTSNGVTYTRTSDCKLN